MKFETRLELNELTNKYYKVEEITVYELDIDSLIAHSTYLVRQYEKTEA